MATERTTLAPRGSAKTTANAATEYARIAAILARLKPGRELNFSIRYRIGVAVSKALEPCCTFEEIGEHFGITKQNAYTLAVTALGSLVCELYLRLHTSRATGQPDAPQTNTRAARTRQKEKQ